jgi:hypothetical protein
MVRFKVLVGLIILSFIAMAGVAQPVKRPMRANLGKNRYFAGAGF